MPKKIARSCVSSRTREDFFSQLLALFYQILLMRWVYHNDKRDSLKAVVCSLEEVDQ